MVTSVGGTPGCTDTERALTTVTCPGGGPAGGRPACTVVGYSDGDSAGAGRGRGAGRGDGPEGLAGDAGDGPGGVGLAGVDQLMVCCGPGGVALGADGAPLPPRAPISNVNRGPPALPMLMLCPS